MRDLRTVGIVNGGDASGLNPVIRATVRSAINEHRMRVVLARRRGTKTSDLCGLRYQPPRNDHSGRRLKRASGIDLIPVMI